MCSIYSVNSIDGVMVRVSASNGVDNAFDFRSGQTKDYRHLMLLY